MHSRWAVLDVKKMNKKILIISILAVLMLVTISLASATNTNTTNTEKKESPLWTIRTKRAISEKINNIIENIKTKFLGERIFFLPFIKYTPGNSRSDPLALTEHMTCSCTIPAMTCFFSGINDMCCTTAPLCWKRHGP